MWLLSQDLRVSQKPFRNVLCALLLGLFCGLPSIAQDVSPPSSELGGNSLLIDFETFPGPDGELGTADDVPTPACGGGVCFPLGSEYNSVGANFGGGWLLQIDFFPDEGPTNHFISSTPMEVTFLRDVFGVSVQSYSLWSARLWALDAQNNVITTNELVHPDEGNSPYFGTLTVSSTTPIARVVLRASSCTLAGMCDPILNADNLRLEFVAQSPVFLDGFEVGDTSAWSDAVPPVP